MFSLVVCNLNDILNSNSECYILQVKLSDFKMDCTIISFVRLALTWEAMVWLQNHKILLFMKESDCIRSFLFK